MTGSVRYLCLKKIVPVTLSDLVSLLYTLKHLWCSMDVPMCHPLLACSAQLPRFPGLSWVRIGHPKGANGFFMKLCGPWTCEKADILGATFDWRCRLSWNSAWSNNLHQRCIGNDSCTPAMTPTKWFLAVWMALSAMFLLWSLGGTSS